MIFEIKKHSSVSIFSSSMKSAGAKYCLRVRVNNNTNPSILRAFTIGSIFALQTGRDISNAVKKASFVKILKIFIGKNERKALTAKRIKNLKTKSSVLLYRDLLEKK